MNILLSLALKRRYLCSLPGRMFFLSTRTYLFLSGRLCSWKKPTAWPSSWIMFPILHRSALLPIVSFWALSPPRPTREAQLVNRWVKQACIDNTCRCIQNFHVWINFNSIRCTAFRLSVVKTTKDPITTITEKEQMRLLKETNSSWDHKNQIAWTAGNASEKLANISKRVFLVPESSTDVIQQGFSIC